MSTLIGTEGERWSLARAIDALGESARQAGHPGLIWVAGFFYPTVTLGLDLGWEGPLTHTFTMFSGGSWVNAIEKGAFWKQLQILPLFGILVFVVAPLAGVAFMPLFRLVAGLARTGPALAWERASAGRRSPRLRTVWSSGRGLTVSTFGLWVQLALMIGGALFLGSLPASALASTVEDPEANLVSAAAIGALIFPILVVLMGYTMALSVLYQLALHSLAHNRRGVYSALLHGWRIMRNDPWATVRAVVVDLVLFLTILMAWRMFTGVSDVLGHFGQSLGGIAKVLLTSFAGVARAGYWARAYRALGGLSPDDGVPGLRNAREGEGVVTAEGIEPST